MRNEERELARAMTLRTRCTLLLLLTLAGCELPTDPTGGYTPPDGPEQARLEVAAVVVSGDPSQDGVLNPGETAYLRIRLRNTGSGSVGSLTGQVTTPSDRIRVLAQSATLRFWGCEAGQECESGVYDLRVEVDRDAAPGTTAELFATLDDGQGHTFPLRCTVRVEAPAGTLTFVGVAVTGDSNQDHVLNPGETAYLELRIRNAGTSRVTATTGPVTSTSEYVTFPGGTPELRFGVCEPGETLTSQVYGLRVRLAPATPPGSHLPFTCPLTDEQGQLHALRFEVPVQATAALLVFAEVEVQDGQDGALSPGESANLRVTVRNAGTSLATASSCPVRANPESALRIKTTNPLLRFAACEPDQRVSADPFSLAVELLAGTPAGTRIRFDCELVDEQQNRYDAGFELVSR